jgi:hypothetical protein
MPEAQEYKAQQEWEDFLSKAREEEEKELLDDPEDDKVVDN